MGGARSDDARGATPIREKREATVRPIAPLPKRSAGFDHASETWQSRSSKLKTLNSNPHENPPSEFMLSLRRFVSHRNVCALRTRRPVPTIRRRQETVRPLQVTEKEGPTLCKTRKEWGHADGGCSANAARPRSTGLAGLDVGTHAAEETEEPWGPGVSEIAVSVKDVFERL